MKFKNGTLLVLLLVNSYATFSMDEPESWSCEIFSYGWQILKHAAVSFSFKCNEPSPANRLFAAIRNKNVTEGATQIAKLLHKYPQLLDEAEDADGMTPLLAATVIGNTGVVTQILNRVSQPNVDRCSHQGFAIVQVGKKSEWLPLSGLTPLMAAAKFNQIDIAKQLLSAGAKKDLQDFATDKKTAVDYARDGGNIAMLDLVRPDTAITP